MADKNFKVKNNIVVNDVEIDPSSPTLDYVLKYNGTKFVAAKSGVPAGGLEGQILSKITDTSFDTQWIDNYADQLRVTCKNGTVSQINKGTAVMAVGAAGDLIKIEPAVANGTVEVKYMLGVASENIAADGQGYVTLVGPIKGLNTNSYTVGTVLYINPSTPGAFTATEPVAPNIDLPLAMVLKQNASSGVIFVRMWSQGAKLGELQDVNTSNVQNNQILIYDSTSSTWKVGNAPSGGGFYVGDTAPGSPSQGDTWYNSDSGRAYIYYDSFWIELGGGGGGGSGGSTGATVSDTAPTGATAGDLWYKSDVSKLYVFYDSFWVQV